MSQRKQLLSHLNPGMMIWPLIGMCLSLGWLSLKAPKEQPSPKHQVSVQQVPAQQVPTQQMRAQNVGISQAQLRGTDGLSAESRGMLRARCPEGDIAETVQTGAMFLTKRKIKVGADVLAMRLGRDEEDHLQPSGKAAECEQTLGAIIVEIAKRGAF